MGRAGREENHGSHDRARVLGPNSNADPSKRSSSWGSLKKTLYLHVEGARRLRDECSALGRTSSGAKRRRMLEGSQRAALGAGVRAEPSLGQEHR